MIEEIAKEGIEKGEIINADSNVIASGIFGFISWPLFAKIIEVVKKVSIKIKKCFII